MKNSEKDYPSVNTWSYITIEGYCMLNMEYTGCKDRYLFELKSDGSLKKKDNDRYDPKLKPDPYPDYCRRSVSSECIRCRHFAWCDPDENFNREDDY